MKIILTNAFLLNHTGSEVYIRDLAIKLKENGFEASVYTLQKGKVAKEIEQRGIMVSNNLAHFQKPDIIHAQHYEVSRRILDKFPDTPAVFFLHNRIDNTEQPLKHQSIKKYISVDYNCKDRYLENGIQEENIGVIYNWADTTRFKQKNIINDTPLTALIFSNYSTKNNHHKQIEKACRIQNIKLGTMGIGYGNSNPTPEKILPNYDIVFAKAKAAMEAIASGAGVIVCDMLNGLAQFVDTENYEYFRRLNFGMKTMVNPITFNGIISEIKKYNAHKIKEVSDLLRHDANFDKIFQQIISEYKKYS